MLRIFIIALVVQIVTLTASISWCADNIGPFGFSIHETTRSDVLARLRQDGIRWAEDGINAYSHGKMMHTTGDGYGLRGLQSVRYIFDRDDKLAAVFLRMDKSRFKAIFSHLNGKHPVVRKDIPFVGDKYLECRKNGVTIMLDAPHMSFKMDVIYITDELLGAFRVKETQDKRAQARKERDAL